jgi:hypothetical protein
MTVTARSRFLLRSLALLSALALFPALPSALPAQQKAPPRPPATLRLPEKTPRPELAPLDKAREWSLQDKLRRDRWDEFDTPLALGFSADLAWKLETPFAPDFARDMARDFAADFSLRAEGAADAARTMRWDAEQQFAKLSLAPLAIRFDAEWGGKDMVAPGLSGRWFGDVESGRPRAPYLQGDPADSLYRLARELLNRGEYRRAAVTFRELSTKMPTSGYAADALYWQAFALYRIGGTTEMRSAIEALELQKEKYPGARRQSENAALSLRIRGALAARGDAAAAATIRTAAGDSALRCDREEQSVRVEALNALTQSDPDGAMPILQKTLARRDSCSVTLRRTAVFLIGNKNRDAASVTLLSQVARNDPSVEVRGSALEWLARVPGDEALSVLEELSRDTSDTRVQQAAVRALVRHPSPRARQLVRTIVERSDSPERLRLEALSAFDKDRATSDDVAWMRTLYSRTDNSRVKARIVNTLASIGGDEVDQWMLAMARNVDESSDTRRYAVRRVGRTLPIAEVARLYDTSAERAIREELIETLAQRAEGEATDKLLDIVKTGTDPQLRSRAISALTRKKDPRTLRLLMEIIDK